MTLNYILRLIASSPVDSPPSVAAIEGRRYGAQALSLKKLPLAFAIAVGLTSFLGYPTLAQVQHSTLISKNPPPPPRTPPPNRRKPGGGLDPVASSCNSTSKPLIALIPIENPVLTASEHPTFLFYVPYTSGEVSRGEFSLLVWPDEKTRLYKTSFALPQTPGIVSITLPPLPEYALKEGQHYRWYFKLYCKGNASHQPDMDLNGGVLRVTATPGQGRSNDPTALVISYDAIANLAESIHASPQNTTLRNNWVNLLKAIGLEDLAREPMAGSVIPLETSSK